MGEWPQLHPAERIARVERFVERLQQKRAEIVNILMWEICKNEDDAKKEVDRTIEYIRSTIVELKKLENTSATFEIVQGYVGHIRRAPYGVVLCLGPFNYPFNETYCTLIPAIIMGNAVVMKLPKVGVLCHQPTLELFKEVRATPACRGPSTFAPASFSVRARSAFRRAW
jgi:glyceraldehyde-3-phosphate dehydrogenase (NADP+)